MVTNLPGVVVGPRLTLDNVNDRLVQLEQVVSTISKTIYTDDSMTMTMPGVVATDAVLDLKDQRIMELEGATLALRKEIDAKNIEIGRLTDLVYSQDQQIDDLNDKLVVIRNQFEDL